MTSEADIQKQLDIEIEKWYSKIYDGKPLPQSFMDMFRKAIMAIPPASHQYNMEKIKVLLAKRPDEVNMIEVGWIINLIYSTPFSQLYETVDQGVDMTMVFDAIRKEYNEISADLERKMMKKREFLMKMGGVTKSVPFNKPLVATP